MIEAHITGDLPPNLQVGDTIDIRGTARVVAVREDLVDVSRFSPGEEFLPGGERHVELLLTLHEHGVTAPPTPRPTPPPVRTVADSEDRSVRGRTLRPWRR